MLGAPHIALRKMISGGVIAAFIAAPLFLVASLLIAYFSPGRWASMAALLPFVVLILASQTVTAKYNVKPGVSSFLGVAIGPLAAELLAVQSPIERARMARLGLRKFSLAPAVKEWSGYFPNPPKVLDATQIKWSAAAIFSTTFVFSPAAMTVILGEAVGARGKHACHRLTTVLSVRNGVTESTSIAEAPIPLIAFDLPPSPIAVDAAANKIENLHSMMWAWEFLGCGLSSVLLAARVASPFSMNSARSAAAFASRRISHEAIIGPSSVSCR